ncbi:hypothetical protein OIU77_006655 [Salix suchowensis]|uniref:non-specific serine/threonine protein kinase n=1 Tax=Salix suchowensis TaxID=1278906 RepID=A0ABQ9ALE8_9ROSI|nr:hypothetical protein OIU77_006655 [Salix suchowensis]
MPISRIWTFGAALLIGLCWSSLLVAAQDATTDPLEVKALRDIKNSLVDINNNLSNWRQGDPCTSNWTGVLCFNSTKEGRYHVRELQLLNMNLSGTLSPSLGRLSYLEILDFMWNNITGSIPPEIGNITSLVLLVLNGNQLTGPIPEELGYLPNLERIQIDQNNISGPIPKSFANLNKTQHLHMNNNSISGHIPAELSRLPSLLHFLLDNNQLSGTLPPELSNFPNLLILQLDNNNFDGSPIPASYGNMTKLRKLSLRNCSLQGPMPDLSGIPNLGYLDLSFNQLAGPIPTDKLSENITTIDLSYNNLNGTIPAYFSELPLLQLLSIANNSLSGSVPSTIWENRANKTEGLDLLKGNPACSNSNAFYCESRNSDMNNQSSTESNTTCLAQSCPPPFEYSPTSPVSCFCAAPLIFGYRLKSPGFSNFIPYRIRFENYLSSGLQLNLYQLGLDSIEWESGPRLQMDLKLFPVYVNETNSHVFNRSEVRRIISMFTGWKIPDNEIFGPYELLYITLSDPYKDVIVTSQKSDKISTGALVGIVLGAIAAAVTLSAVVSLLILRARLRNYPVISKRRRKSKAALKIEGVKDFSYAEMALATNKFSSSSQMLVYEFMPNGTLRDHLSMKGKETLSFAKRMKIAVASAKGILYLHTEADPPIFHRDIKASNILLDSRYNAKVADFGLSRLAPVPDIEGSVPDHISTVVKGTPGYLDPEYFLTHKLTDKSDVYSLGVVFLELLTGRQPISHGKNIVREVHIAYQSGMILSIIDEQMGSYPSDCVDKFLTLAMKCCNGETDARPSMADVVRELESIWHMVSESDTATTDITSIDNGEEMTPPPSSSMMTNPCVSSEVSGSDLVSGVVPTIPPR